MPELKGNTAGLKASQTRALRALYRRRVPRDAFVTPELARRLAECSRAIGRQVGLVLDRSGSVRHVVVGDAHQVFLPDLGRHRAGPGRLRGLRLVLTHLRPQGVDQDNLTDLALLRLDAVVVLEVGADGLPGRVHLATLAPPEHEGDDRMWSVETFPGLHAWEQDLPRTVGDIERALARQRDGFAVDGRPRAVLVGVALRDAEEGARSLEELERLADTAGLHVVHRLLQRRRRPDQRYVIGRGKLREVLLDAMHLGAEVLVFDGELSPAQLRNIATATDLSVLDRTQLILDIFAQRARTREGKLQVELAQLRYRRPRLAVMPTAMSRLTGGIGGRGPGETRLEINRRRADERATRLARELQRLGRGRSQRRARRKRVGLPLVSLVGYTNAGKSTLLNRMTASAVDARDRLFATLDPTSRRLRFPEEREVILTDTVGFIRNLPRDLVEAFRSTLEEVVEADLLLHVVDAASPELDRQVEAVESVLEVLGVADRPRLVVYNKADLLDPERAAILARREDAIPCSAVTGEGLDVLLRAIESELFRERARRSSGQLAGQAAS